MSDSGNHIDEIISDGMKKGAFDNLPGKGKPLRLDENPYEDPEWRVANHLLKSNDFTLPWIAASKEIETDLEQMRADLRRAWQQRQAENVSSDASGAEAEWQRAVARFQQQLLQINQKIRNYNLEVPDTRFQRPVVQEKQELERIAADTEAADGES